MPESRNIAVELRQIYGEAAIRPDIDRILIRQEGARTALITSAGGPAWPTDCSGVRDDNRLFFDPTLPPGENTERLLAYREIGKNVKLKIPKWLAEAAAQALLRPATVINVKASEMYRNARHDGSKEMCRQLITHVEQTYPDALFHESFRMIENNTIRSSQLLFRPRRSVNSKFFTINAIPARAGEIKPPYIYIEVQGKNNVYDGLTFARMKYYSYTRIWAKAEHIEDLKTAVNRSWNHIQQQGI